MKKFVCLVMFVFSCVACEGSSTLRKMSNSELVAKRDECMRVNPTAPGRVTACENVRRECERRRKDGNYAC